MVLVEIKINSLDKIIKVLSRLFSKQYYVKARVLNGSYKANVSCSGGTTCFLRLMIPSIQTFESTSVVS